MNTHQWSALRVDEVVYEAVLKFTGKNTSVEWTIADIKDVISKKSPDFNLRTVESQIISGCVNHPSRQHHFRSTSQNRYERIGRGKYRLYDPTRDSV